MKLPIVNSLIALPNLVTSLVEEWIETFEENIIEEGEVVATHSWESDNPGAGAGMTLIYRFRGLFFTSDDFGINGPHKTFSEAAEAVGLLTVTETTERIWVDLSVNFARRLKTLSP